MIIYNIFSYNSCTGAISSFIQIVFCDTVAVAVQIHCIFRSGEEKLKDEIKPCVGIPEVFELSYYSNHVISVFLLESLIGNCLTVFLHAHFT